MTRDRYITAAVRLQAAAVETEPAPPLRRGTQLDARPLKLRGETMTQPLPDRPVTQNQLTVDGPNPKGVRNPASGRTRKPRAPYVPLVYTCGGCDNTWSGVNRAHCSGCHRTWSGPSMFDQHRRLIKEVGICVDPATIKGQVFKGGIWRSDKERTPDTWGGAE